MKKLLILALIVLLTQSCGRKVYRAKIQMCRQLTGFTNKQCQELVKKMPKQYDNPDDWQQYFNYQLYEHSPVY
jgi:hypothetical protein